MCDGEEVDLLHAVAAFHVHVAEYDAATCAADDACGVPFPKVPDDFVLEDVAQEYERAEQCDDGPEE